MHSYYFEGNKNNSLWRQIFKFNLSKKVKVTSYGEATVLYKVAAQLKRKIVIGKSTIRKTL